MTHGAAYSLGPNKESNTDIDRCVGVDLLLRMLRAAENAETEEVAVDDRRPDAARINNDCLAIIREFLLPLFIIKYDEYTRVQSST